MTNDVIEINLCKNTPDSLCETLDFELDSYLKDLIQTIADKENRTFTEVLENVLQDTIENIIRQYG